jgi:hypothetical protein
MGGRNTYAARLMQAKRRSHSRAAWRELPYDLFLRVPGH